MIVSNSILIDLHCAIFITLHNDILRHLIHVRKVVRSDHVLVTMVWVVSPKSRHVHRQLWIWFLFLDWFHDLVIIHRANVFHVLLVLQGLLNGREVEYLIVRAHRVV